MKHLSLLLTSLLTATAATAATQNDPVDVAGFKYLTEKHIGYNEDEYVAILVDVDRTLTDVVIPETITISGQIYKVKEIAPHAFINNTIVRTISGKSITTLGDPYVDYIAEEKSQYYEMQPSGIEAGCFAGCTALESIDLENVETIGIDCFNGCSSLKEANMPNIKSIGARAFKNCTSLEKVVIGSPDGYTSFVIDYLSDWEDPESHNTTSFFSGCTSLQSFKLLSVPYEDDNQPNISMATWKSWTPTLLANTLTDCTSLTELVVPRADIIQSHAIDNAPALKKLDLNNARYISMSNNAFNNCYFDEVICRFPIPPLCSDDPFSISETARLIVPKGCRDIYAADNFWGRFNTIVESEDINPAFDMAYSPGIQTSSKNYVLNDDGKTVGYRLSILSYKGTNEDGLPIFSNDERTYYNTREIVFYVTQNTYTDGDITYDVTSVAPYACANNIIREVKLGNNINTICTGAFSYSTFSKFIYEPFEINLGENLTHIGAKAFYKASFRDPIEFELPASLTHIGEDAFKAVTGLDSFRSLAVTPPVIDGDGFFTDASTRHDIKVYVPENSVDAYRSAKVWCDFEILPIESGVESIMSDATEAPVYYNLQGIRVDNPEHGTYIRVSGNRAVKIRL